MLKKMLMAGLMTATMLGGVAPAYAQHGDGGWRGRDGGERAGRPDRGGGGGGGRPDVGRSVGDGQRMQRWQGGDTRQQAPDQRWRQRSADRAVQPDQPRIERQWRGGTGGDGGNIQRSWRSEGRVVEQTRPDRPQWQDNRRNGRVEWRNRGDNRWEGRWNNNDRGWNGNVGVARRFDDRTRWTGQRRWDSGWRNDRRYDWSSYRSRYGDRYRIGRYYAPRGWNYGYSRYSIGIFLNSLLFADSYWIDDPWSYRLPPAYGTLRWIRYYDDALLVDIRDGYVVDVIHDFFW